MISVLIADDHSLIRKVLQGLLERAGDIQIVAVASDGREAVAKAVLHHPSVAVLDLFMPALNGIEGARQICAYRPETRVLIASLQYSSEHIRGSLQAGALGYVLKDVADDVVRGVRSVSQGNRYFSQQVAEVARKFI